MMSHATNSSDVWSKCLEVIRDNLNTKTYKTWFEPIKPLQLENNILTIEVPSQFFYEWIEEHYVQLLSKTIRRFLGPEAKLSYSIVMQQQVDNEQSYRVKMPTTFGDHKVKNPPVNLPMSSNKPPENPFVIPGLKKITLDSHLNPSCTFDNFIEGDCNRMARAAGMNIAARPGETSYNPMLIYGRNGLGKTHLAQAIGNEVKRRHPDKVVVYVSSEKFTNQYVESVKQNAIGDFISTYQLVDVLIMDDIHFLAGKDSTQDIFFHVFNSLHQKNKQIILTCDMAPSELKGMVDRLISRFKWGLSADLTMPDLETRQAILRHKMALEGIEIPEEVIEYIAYNIKSSVRELEGAMISIIAQSSFNRKPINQDLACQVIKNFVKNATRELSIDTIQKIVADYFNVSAELLKDRTRKREVVQPRQIAMSFSKEFTKSSLKTIGLHFGGRDHSTVIHALNTVSDLCYADKEFNRYVEELRKKIKLSTG